MKLEELAGALTELKEKLFISIQEEAAGEANETLLSELRKRIMAKQPEPVKKKMASKPIDMKLNEQQSKFLKSVPDEGTEEPAQRRATADSIRVQRSANRYVIGIDSDLPEQIKDLAKVTDADTQQYLETIKENAQKQSDQLL